MGRALRILALLALAGAAAWATLRWPHLDTVETGKTPEYPALQPRDYAASEAEVMRAARATIDSLGWTHVASGSGRGGSEIQAQTRGAVLPTGYLVSVRVQRVSGRTRVSVLSRSRTLPWDFGENARLIEAFLAALDRDLALTPR
jgi:hypothetical protein